MADHNPPPMVSVTPAGPAERGVIEGLMAFYIYDFSEMEPAGSAAFGFNAAGGFDPYPELARYWGRAGFHPLLIRVDGALAGFALINTHSHRDGSWDGPGLDHNMAEFFVARKYRRRGVAARAVAQLLRRFPGRWEVAVAQRNAPARAFWPRAIGAAAGVSRLSDVASDGAHWRGPIWTFAVSP